MDEFQKVVLVTCVVLGFASMVGIVISVSTLHTKFDLIEACVEEPV